MKRYLPLVSALVLGFSFLGSISTVRGIGGTDALMPKEITKEEAAKKYPPPAGKSYPQGVPQPTSTGGFLQSPYSSRIYDCRKLNHKALVLDEGVNKVFIVP
jgi:hypothetical protein